MARKKRKLNDLSVAAAAAELSMKPETVRYHIRENGLPAVKDGGVWRIPRRPFERWKRTQWVYLSRKKGAKP